MLQEVQLFIAGGEGEVITRGPLTALLGTKGRISQNNIKVLHALPQGRKGITQLNLTVDIMEHGIHKGKAVSVVDKLTAGEGLIAFKLGCIGIQIVEIVSSLADMAVGCNHETESATSRVVAALTGLRVNKAGHDVNEHTGSKVLASTGLLLIGILLQQAFIKVSQALFTGRVPVKSIDIGDDFLKVFGLFDIGGRALVNLTDTACAVITEMGEQSFVKLLEFNTTLADKVIPAVTLGDVHTDTAVLVFYLLSLSLLGHLEKKDIGKLGDILVVSDTVIPEHITQVPELGYYFLGCHALCPPSS